MYIPKDWIVNEENTDKLHELLDNYCDVGNVDNEEEVSKALEEMGETTILEKWENGTF